MSIRITYEQLEALMRARFGTDWTVSDRRHQNSRYTQREILQGIVDHQHHLARFDLLENRFRIMHSIGSQFPHEADQYRTTREYHDGSNYEDRADLGNTEPGDGQRFRGRGIIMLTGRYNYTAASERLGIDLVGNPDLAEDIEISCLTAGDYWQAKKINRWADADHEENIVEVTKLVNGGLNGYDDRKAYFMAAGTVWTEDATAPTPEAEWAPLRSVGPDDLVLVQKKGVER